MRDENYADGLLGAVADSTERYRLGFYLFFAHNLDVMNVEPSHMRKQTSGEGGTWRHNYLLVINHRK